MPDVKIIADSSCDLTESLIAENDIDIVPFSVSFDGEVYKQENIEISNKEFYTVMREQVVYPKTSLPTIDAYAQKFREYTSKGLDVICVSLTSKFSGSHQSAVNAAEIVNDELKQKKVFAVDSIQATCAEGAIVLEAVKMKNAGFSAERIYEKINILKETCIMYITVETLAYLQRGGRIGKANALLGGLLNIKPTIVLKDGELQPVGKVRGRKKSLTELAAAIERDLKGQNKDDYEFFISSADERDEITEFAAQTEKDFGIKLSYPIMDVGITIGAHVGPGAVGFGYMKKYTKM